MIPDRRKIAGGLYEGHWEKVRATIEALIAGGETDLARLINLARKTATDQVDQPLLRALGYRVAGHAVPATICDRQLEVELFTAHRLWALRRAIPADVTDIVELGSGFGTNLFDLWLGGLSPDIRFHALEYTAAGRACAERIASLVPKMKFRSAAFDYYNADLGALAEARKVFVFTSHSIEQITHIPASFFERLLAVPGLASVLHIEPVGWQYGLPANPTPEAIELDGLMRASVTRKGYNQSLIPQLQQLAKAGVIVIDEEFPHLYSSRPDLPTTVIRWHRA